VVYQHLKAGDTLGGRYRIESLLGQGGMGSVFLAEDLKLKGKKWAVKECVQLGTDVQGFLDEAEMLAQLQHPQLPQLVDYFASDTGGYAYLVMDYIQGPTLDDVFERSGRDLTVDRVVRYALQLCDLFQYLHSFRPKAIIYRDLKPSNVMINEHDQVRLIDFGVARHFTQGKHADTLQIGTLGFAAPEQLVGAQTDARSDLYTLGAMMYYLFSGGRYMYITQTPLAKLRPDLPQALAETVQMLLRDNPAERCQTAAEVQHRLTASMPSNPAGRKSRAAEPVQGSTPITRKLVVVGSLYAGAGSTFTAITLARVLHACGIPQALIEQPTNEPDLYMLLYGDSKAPPQYTFASEPGEVGASFNHSTWETGLTTWVPAHPEGISGPWTPADSFKLLYAQVKPIVIWDVSANWEEESVQELCHSADEILVVLDASPAKINRPSSRAYLKQLLAYQARGKSVRFIANRDMPYGIRQEWLDSLPGPLLCTLPELPYESVMRSVWKGECIQDQPEVMDKMRSAMYPLLSRLISEETLLKQVPKPKTLFSRFKRFS
jgi:serine/threonine protein kinase